MTFLRCPSRCLHCLTHFQARVEIVSANWFPSITTDILLFLSLPSHLLLCIPPLSLWDSLVLRLQSTATRGLKWSPCTPRWWSALRAPRPRWARPWKRPWGPSKTLCSRPSLVSRTESRDQVNSQLFVSFYNEEILNVTSWPTCFIHARTWTPSAVTWSDRRRTERRGRLGTRSLTFICIIICFSCELIMSLPRFIFHTQWLHSHVNDRDLKHLRCCLWV